MKRNVFTLGVTVAVSLFCVSLVLAQSSANFLLSWATLGAGGGQRTSANFVIQDEVGALAGNGVTSANFTIQSGFPAGLDSAPSSNATPTATPLPPQAGGDTFEDDDVCVRARAIATDSTKQNHTFHDSGDSDWLRFTAQAGKTYIVKVNNLSAQSDAVINFFDACNETLAGQGQNSFGTEVVLEWDATKNGDYFFQLQQFDPAQFGDGVTYEVSVTADTTPPSAPQSIRCIAVDATTLGVQWKRNAERDVKGYRVTYAGNISGVDDVSGGATTFAQISGLITGQTYNVNVRAIDFSNNQSTPSGEAPCLLAPPADTTKPVVALDSPTSSNDVITITGNTLTFSGIATDNGNNLSRVRVLNETINVRGWDYSLNGNNDNFRVENLQMAVGVNTVKVDAFDTEGNNTQLALTVNRQGNAQGAVLIVAGRNETNGLQGNIYNAANRAYRIFKTAGFSEDAIYYIAPTQQDADKDGLADDVDAAPSTAAALQNAVLTWASDKVGPGKPLFVYMIDHGFEDKFCLDGCATGSITPADLTGWLTTLETNTGVDQVTVVIEACLSGSFVTRTSGADNNSLVKPGRIIITSTSDNKNAYASAEGAYFSDAFFSCIADSQDLKTCFEEGKAAVATTGVSQFPQLDDNGDAVYNNGDGAVAQTRFVTRFFGSLRPTIQRFTVERQGANGTLSATVKEGAEQVGVVWAAVYPPGFVEPQGVTLNLNVPTVRLEPNPNAEGQYTFNYVNGFTESGDYRVVLYAQDRLGIHATPRLAGEGPAGALYLPLIRR